MYGLLSIAVLQNATRSSWDGRGNSPGPLYVLESSSHQNLRSVLHFVLPFTPYSPLPHEPCPCVRLGQTFLVAITQRYLLLRPIVALTLTCCYSPPTCTTFKLHESSHEVLGGSFELFHASLTPLARPKTNQIYHTLTI